MRWKPDVKQWFETEHKTIADPQKALQVLEALAEPIPVTVKRSEK